jgi:hypothetical protein
MTPFAFGAAEGMQEPEAFDLGFWIGDFGFYTAFHKNIAAGISGCRKKPLNNGTFF